MYEANWEYFCFNCGQLRLYLTKLGDKSKPIKCRNCQSYNIKIGEINTLDKEKLKEKFYNQYSALPNQMDLGPKDGKKGVDCNGNDRI